MKIHYVLTWLLALLLLLRCDNKQQEIDSEIFESHLVVLGTTQDGGFPQLGCVKLCCQSVPGENQQPKRLITSLGLYDAAADEAWLFEATPDIRDQWKQFTTVTKTKANQPSGIFLTHAHIGHYSGLMFLGFESQNTASVPVYVMPRMKKFLEQNGPWSQLTQYNNIVLRALPDTVATALNGRLSVTPFLVPHRDEFSETVGYKIQGPKFSAIFIPDIDKWEKWNTSLKQLVENNDYLFLDATFFNGNELPGRDITKVPHPFVSDTMKALEQLSSEMKKRIYFIHMNHTNPILRENSDEARLILSAGFNIAREGLKLPL